MAPFFRPQAPRRSGVRGALLAGLVALAAATLWLPPASATLGSPLRIDATAAAGWTNPDNILGTGDASYASTLTQGETLAVGFADPAWRGPISTLKVKIDQQQVSHSNDQIVLTVTAGDCSTVLATPHELSPTATRTTLSAALTCEEGWTWARVAALSASLQANAVGANLISNGIDGEWRVFRVWLQANYTDDPPWVDAGPDQVVGIGGLVQLNGVASDPESLPLSYSWVQLSGPGVTLSAAGAAAPTFTAPQPGGATLTFRLTATDADGQAATDAVSITIDATNRAPVAEAGPDQAVRPGEAVGLVGSAEDPDGDALTYQWTQVAGVPVALSGAGTPTASFTAPASGVVAFALRATDSRGMASPADRVTVTVAAPAAPDGALPGGNATPAAPPGDGAAGGGTAGDGAAGGAPPGPGPCTQGVSFGDRPDATMRFASSCGLLAATIPAMASVANATRLHLRSTALDALPPSVPAPPSAATAFVDVVLVGDDGQARQPGAIDLVLPVRLDWLAEHCPPPGPPAGCRIVVWHYHDGRWTALPAEERGRNATHAEVGARADALSLFAVGAVRAGLDPVAGGGGGPAARWPWLAAGAAVVAGGASALWWRRSRSRNRPPRPRALAPPAAEGAEGKVSRLLAEMRTNEQLLQFVNNAAHDLANPLSPIQIQLHMLAKAAEAQQDERGRKALSIVQRNVDQLGLLVADLKDAARLQAGQLRLALAAHDLGRVAAEAVESAQAQADAAGIRLVCEARAALPVRADAQRLAQVLGNLLGNALKFTPAGGSVRVVATQEGPMGLVLVRDTGLGLSAEGRARLFRPFSQAHGDAERAKGTGLGLYISKGIVEAHGGQAGCESDGPGTGSTFWFTIPLDPAGPAGP